MASAVTIEDLLKANHRTGFSCRVLYYKNTEDMRLTSASECEVIVRDTKSFLAWAKSAKSKEKELNKNNKTDVFFEINFMSEDIRMPSRKPRGHEKVLIKEGKRYVENIEYKNEAGKNIPNRVCMTSDVKDAKEFTFEEAAAIQNDFSMVFPSLKKQGSYLQRFKVNHSMRLLLSRMLMAQRSLLRKILAPAFSLRWMRKAQSDMQISHPHKKCALH